MSMPPSFPATATPLARELVFLSEQTGKDEAVLLSEALRLGLELLYRKTVEQNFLAGRLTRAEAIIAIGEKAVAQLEQRASLLRQAQEPQTALRVTDLNAFFARLPNLEEDMAAFARDVESARSALPVESNPRA